MITSANVRTENDLMYIKFLLHKLDMRLSGGGRDEPQINKLNLTAIEYREFLSTF